MREPHTAVEDQSLTRPRAPAARLEIRARRMRALAESGRGGRLDAPMVQAARCGAAGPRAACRIRRASRLPAPVRRRTAGAGTAPESTIASRNTAARIWRGCAMADAKDMTTKPADVADDLAKKASDGRGSLGEDWPFVLERDAGRNADRLPRPRILRTNSPTIQASRRPAAACLADPPRGFRQIGASWGQMVQVGLSNPQQLNAVGAVLPGSQARKRNSPSPLLLAAADCRPRSCPSSTARADLS